MSIWTHKALVTNNRPNQAFEVGSISPVNSAGPSAKHFFPANEGSGTTLTDVIGGANLATATNAWGTGPNGGGYHDGADSAEATAAAFNDFTTNDFAFFFVCDRGDKALAATTTFGGGGAGDLTVGFAMGSVIGGSVAASVDDNVTPIEFTAVALPGTGDTSTTEVSVGIVKNGNTGTVWISVDGTITTENKDFSGLASFQPNQELQQGSWLYGMAAWEFASGLPSDWQTAFAWMNTRWRANQKVLYPNWVDD